MVLEKTLGSPLDFKEIQPVHPKGDQSWIFTGRTDAEAETPILWPPDKKQLIGKDRAWCWERLKAGGEGANRGWNGWMALPTWWTWVWVSSGSCWWTGKPGVLQSMGSQRVRWLSDWTELTYKCSCESLRNLLTPRYSWIFRCDDSQRAMNRSLRTLKISLIKKRKIYAKSQIHY